MDISFRGCMWRDGMFLVKKVKCDSVVGVCPDTKTIVGAQGIRGSILEQADLWWYGGGGELVGGKFCGIYEEGEGLPKKFEGGQDKRLGGEWVAIYSFLRLLLSWSDVLCVSGDVIFSTLKSMLHARRIGVKRVEKATGEYFSNLSELENTIASHPQFVWKTGGQKRGVQEARRGVNGKAGKKMDSPLPLCTEMRQRMQETFSHNNKFDPWGKRRGSCITIMDMILKCTVHIFEEYILTYPICFTANSN